MQAYDINSIPKITMIVNKGTDDNGKNEDDIMLCAYVKILLVLLLFRESALIDRIHGFIKGWDIPRMNDDLKLSGWRCTRNTSVRFCMNFAMMSVTELS